MSYVGILDFLYDQLKAFFITASFWSGMSVTGSLNTVNIQNVDGHML